MTHAFVHGNPETDAIWGPLVGELVQRGIGDLALLSPPGFGADAPRGWSATMPEYVTWLAAELSNLDAPIDIVGHDWGAAHVYGLLAAHPAAVRSWAADCAGLVHPNYEWHETAQGWQTLEVGEAMIAAMNELDEGDRMAVLTDAVGADAAAVLAPGIDDEMGRCILALYRSGRQPAMRDLGERLRAAPRAPGLAITPAHDAYVPAALTREMATLLDASVCELPTSGHWWMLEEPEATADALVEFWSTLD